MARWHALLRKSVGNMVLRDILTTRLLRSCLFGKRLAAFLPHLACRARHTATVCPLLWTPAAGGDMEGGAMLITEVRAGGDYIDGFDHTPGTSPRILASPPMTAARCLAAGLMAHRPGG
jgi:hypothetical protein